MDSPLPEQLHKELDCLLTTPYDRHRPSLLDLYFVYRLLLTRNPEGITLEWFRQHLAGQTIPTLVNAVMNSEEFRLLSNATLPSGAPVEVSTVLPGGLRFHFHLQDHAIGCAVAQGTYESSLVKVLDDLVRPGMTCIDAGANIGFVSLLMARSAGPQGCVHAFEPFPQAFDLLLTNIRANGFEDRIRPIAKALHCATGTTRIFFPDSLSAQSGTMFIPGVSAPDQIPGHRSIEVEQVRADDLFVQGHQIDLVKIDVEGSEPHVLRGMERILKECRPTVIVEFNPWCLQNLGGSSPQAFLDQLREYGYSIVDADDYVAGDGKPFEWTPSQDTIVYNLLCRPVPRSLGQRLFGRWA